MSAFAAGTAHVVCYFEEKWGAVPVRTEVWNPVAVVLFSPLGMNGDGS
jgi:hypothetical protein